MNSVIELGKDGQILEWRQHLLSVVVKARQLDALALESVLHPKGSFQNLQLNFKSDANGVSWSWENWSLVVATPCGTEPSAPLIRRFGQPPHLTWREVADCEAIELTPHDSQGAGGMTVRVERPLILSGESVKFQSYGQAVRVTLLNYTSTKDVFIQLLRKDYETGLTGEHNHVFKREGVPIAFNSNKLVEVSPDRLRRFNGVIAVVRRVRQKYYLLKYSNYIKPDRNSFSFDLRPQVEDEGDVRRAVETHKTIEATTNNAGLEDWLGQWPDRSQRNLRELYQYAVRRMQPAAAVQCIRHSPTGLLRYIVLDLCDFSGPGWLDQRIQQLNTGTFQEALKRLDPHLPQLLESVQSPAAMEWVIKHANHPRLSEVVEWVGNMGEPALEMALSLLNVRAEAVNLKNQLRADSVEGCDAARLLVDIEAAPGTTTPPHELSQRLKEIIRRVERDEKRPIYPEADAPVTNIRYQTWLKSREQILGWRRDLDQILMLCESGKWESSAAAPLPERLEQRLRQIKKPPARPVQKQDARIEEIKLFILKLLERAEDEPRQTLRELARAQLQKVVLPHIYVWGVLHGDINKALELSATYSWFSASFGIAERQREINERAQAAERFLQTVAAAEKFAESWRVKSQSLKQQARGKTELRKILSTPDHPWVSAAYEQSKKLYEFLSLTSFVQGIGLPAQSPSPPRELTLQSLNAWQEELRNLDLVLSRLEWAMKRFESSVKSVRDEILPQLIECIADWEKRRPEQRPPYFEELAGLYQKCFGVAGAITPFNLEALLTFLHQTSWRKDHKEIFRRRSDET